MFYQGSRYANVETASLTDGRGREVTYKRIRFIPPSTPRYGYAVAAGDRLDIIAFELFGDAERFWRICDANEAMWPPRLTAQLGQVIGIPGAER